METTSPERPAFSRFGRWYLRPLAALAIVAVAMSFGPGIAHAAPKSSGVATVRPPYLDAYGSGYCTDMSGSATCTRTAAGTLDGSVDSSVELAAPAPGGTGLTEANGIVRTSFQLGSPARALEITVTVHVDDAEAAEDTTGGGAHSIAGLAASATHQTCGTCRVDTHVDIADSESVTAEPAEVTNQTVTVTYVLRNTSGGDIPAGWIWLSARAHTLAQFGYLVAPCGCAGSNFPAIGFARASIDATVERFRISPLAA